MHIIRTLKSNERGSILVFTVIGLMSLLLLMGLAVDVTYFFVVKNQVRNFADTAALAAMGAYFSNDGATIEEDIIAGKAAAQQLMRMTSFMGDGRTVMYVNFGIYNEDLTFDLYDPDTQPVINAAKVNILHDYTFVLRSITKIGKKTLNVDSISGIMIKNILFVMDVSGSMDDNTYPTNPYDSKPNDKEYYNFKSFPVTAYTARGKNLGGLPQPIHDIVARVETFFRTTLRDVMLEDDKVGFLTFSLIVQDIVKQLSYCNTIVPRDASLISSSGLDLLGDVCSSTMSFYQNYIDEANSVPLSSYNPVRYSNYYNNYFVTINGRSPLSTIDYKYTQLNDRFPESKPAMFHLEDDWNRYEPYYWNQPILGPTSDKPIIFPGERYPTGEDTNRDGRRYYSYYGDIAPQGNTNMGQAFLNAKDIFDAELAANRSVPMFNMVILLTDGLPNVAANYSYQGYYSTGQSFARTTAKALRDIDVRIATVYYRTADDGGTAEAFLMNDIASSPEYAFSAENPEDVENIFNDLMQTFPYVLVK